MLRRKIQSFIEGYFSRPQNKVLLIDGARQIGKSYIVREVGQKLFKHYVEIDLKEDSLHDKVFASVATVSDFYLQLSSLKGGQLGAKEDTLVFLDEIQSYPVLLTLLKFLKADDRYTYVCSGSLLGVTLQQTPSIPIGSILQVEMYPLDFEEFLWANNVGEEAIESMRQKFLTHESLPEDLHKRMLGLFQRYLITGGMPDAINTFLQEMNVVKIRNVQQDIHRLYALDASQYDNEHRLKIRAIYDMIPSILENKKKRVIVKKIENKAGKQYSDYESEFEYLVSAGIALDVTAVSNPKFPLVESAKKSLLKLYLSDVGILTGLLYDNNIRPLLDDVRSVNLGTVYESVVAQELKAHGFKLYYFDNKHTGEVDFLVDDFENLSVLPIEVKSGKDYTVHSALSHFLSVPDYGVKQGIVLSQNREVKVSGNVLYLPIYYVMFLTGRRFIPTAADIIPPLD